MARFSADGFFIPAEGFFGNFSKNSAPGGLAARLFDSEALRAPIPAERNEIYKDLATGRPVPFLRVGQVDAFADASVSFADIQTSSFGSMRTSTGCVAASVGQ